MKPAVIWFTGLSGAGKSTVSERVCEALEKRGHQVEYLDGDAVRAVLPATGFTRRERDQHIRYLGYLASRLERRGVFVIASFVSPYQASRDFVRSICENFIEVYVSTPLAECERRDPKGLYARARRGEITNFTGLSDPYEPPASPEVGIDTSSLTVEEAVDRVVSALRLHAAAA